MDSALLTSPAAGLGTLQVSLRLVSDITEWQMR